MLYAGSAGQPVLKGARDTNEELFSKTVKNQLPNHKVLYTDTGSRYDFISSDFWHTFRAKGLQLDAPSQHFNC
jgi:hypothetical protein